MDRLITTIAWPAVVLIVVLVFIAVFRNPIATLITRTRRIGIGKGALEAYEVQPSPPLETKRGHAEVSTTFDSPLLPQAEQLILQDLENRNIKDSEEKEKALIRTLAAANISIHFEYIYGILWASQVNCLRYLNSREGGSDLSELKRFYDEAKIIFPAWYENYTYENWLGFLKNVSLVTEAASARISITVAGREFLKYLITTAKPGPYFG